MGLVVFPILLGSKKKAKLKAKVDPNFEMLKIHFNSYSHHAPAQEYCQITCEYVLFRGLGRALLDKLKMAQLLYSALCVKHVGKGKGVFMTSVGGIL